MSIRDITNVPGTNVFFGSGYSASSEEVKAKDIKTIFFFAKRHQQLPTIDGVRTVGFTSETHPQMNKEAFVKFIKTASKLKTNFAILCVNGEWFSPGYSCLVLLAKGYPINEIKNKFLSITPKIGGFPTEQFIDMEKEVFEKSYLPRVKQKLKLRTIKFPSIKTKKAKVKVK